MKIYVVAHENIVCPKEYRKVEIMKEDVEGYAWNSARYEQYRTSGRRVLCGFYFKYLVI